MKSYQDLLKYVLENGEHHNDRTGVGTTSVFGYQWRHRMSEGFPLLTTKFVPLRVIFEELIWMLRGGRHNQELLDKDVTIWNEWATEEACGFFDRPAGDLGPIYGPMLRAYPVGVSPDDNWVPKKGTVDQIKNLHFLIDENPNSRRLVVNMFHPHFSTRVTLPPCHHSFTVRVHESSNAMSLHMKMRSCDAFLGLPFNIAQYGLLLLMLCDCHGMVPRDLIISFDDLHIYSNHKEQVALQLSREPRPLPKVVVQNPNVAFVWEYEWEDICLLNYSPHPRIKAPVAV